MNDEARRAPRGPDKEEVVEKPPRIVSGVQRLVSGIAGGNPREGPPTNSELVQHRKRFQTHNRRL